MPSDHRATADRPTAPRGAPEARPAPPWPVAVAAVGALVEAVLLVAGGVVWTVVLLTGGSDAPGAGVALVVLVLCLAVVLVAAARALWRGSRRARGPLVTWQLLQGATAVALLQTPHQPGAVAAGAVAAVGVALGVVAATVSPRATDYLV